MERLFGDRTKDSMKCQKMIRPYDAMDHPLITPDETVPSPAPNWNVQFLTGITTYYNTWKAKKSATDIHFDWNTWVRPVPDGCKLFSHRSCDKMPFFAEDDDNGPLTLAHLEWMKNFTKAHSKLPIMWMVIPNKTTVYLKPDYSKDFEAGFRTSGLPGPDLFAFTREKHTQIRTSISRTTPTCPCTASSRWENACWRPCARWCRRLPRNRPEAMMARQESYRTA